MVPTTTLGEPPGGLPGVSKPPNDRELTEARWRVGGERDQGLAEPFQSRPCAGEACMVAILDPEMIRDEDHCGPESTDVFGDNDPALCHCSFKHALVIDAPEGRPVRR